MAFFLMPVTSSKPIIMPMFSANILKNVKLTETS